MLQRGLEMFHALTLHALPWALRLPGPATVAGAAVLVASVAVGRGRGRR